MRPFFHRRVPALPPTGLALLLIVFVVVAANLPYVTGLTDPNPLGPRSLLGISQPGFVRGANTLDPNDGYISQSLGHLAATDVLHGHLPWWNPYEGAGAPLAAEGQSAALFPLTLLLAVGNGQFYEHMILELIAGMATYLVLRRLRLRQWASVAGGAAFALNGTFAWLANAPFNPVAFLPLLVLGIELAHDAARAGRRGGWWLIAVALALSLYAGFPETAYIDGLFAGAWLIWRCGDDSWSRWRPLAIKAAAGAGAGALLAAPILVAFFGSLPHENVGIHAGLEGGMQLPRLGLTQLLLPYVYGPPLAFSDLGGQIGALWGRTGGFLGASLVFFGVLALLSSRRRGLKLWLCAWIVLVLARMYGEPPVLGHVLGVFPRMSSVAFFRYAFPSLEFGLTILAATGIDDLTERVLDRRRMVAAAIVALGAIAAAAAVATSLAVAPSLASTQTRWIAAAAGWATVVVLIAAAAVWLRSCPALLACILIIDGAAMFGLRELAAPRSVRVDSEPVTYLRGHLGRGRFFTFGPIQPQYGAYWRIASINDDDVPVPTRWTDYVNARLDPVVNALVFVGNFGGDRQTSVPTPMQEFLAHVPAYRQAGVSYVVSAPGQSLPRRFRLVLRAPTAWIYRLTGAATYFSTGSGCQVAAPARDRVRLVCRRPEVLIRRELAFPGWSARIDGRSTSIRTVDRTFQGIAVPAGTHAVTFDYSPPYMIWGLVGLLLGVAWLGAAPALSAIARRSSSDPAGHLMPRPRSPSSTGHG